MGREINPGIGGAGSAIITSSAPAAVTEDPRKEGWPLYLNIYGDGNSYWTVRVLDHELRAVSSPWSAALNTTLSYKGGVLNDSVWGYSVDAAALTGRGTSQAYSFSNLSIGSALHDDQYPQSSMINSAVGGMFEGTSPHASTSNHKFGYGHYLITQILPEGIRPRRYFGIDGNYFYEYHNLNSMNGRKNRINLSDYRDNTSLNDCYGYACYNERTNTLVTVHRGGSNGTVNIFKGRSDLNLNKEASTPNIKDWFEAATVTSFANNNFVNGSANDERTGRVGIGDNGEIVCIEHHSSLMRYRLFRDGEYIKEYNISTGGYSPDDGLSQYYIRMKATWDNNWIIPTASYYQEASEVSSIFISTKNPSRFFGFYDNTGNTHRNFVPHRGSGFLLFNNENTDGAAEPLCRVGLEHDSNAVSGEDPITVSYGQNAIPTEINVGTTIQSSFYSSAHNHGYYSTSYGFYIPTHWWSRHWEHGNG